MHVMMDVETMGKRPGAVIRSIGAALFDPYGVGWTEIFYANIDQQSCLDAGLRIEKETADWWDRQSPEAHSAFLPNHQPLGSVVASFNAWWISHRAQKIWCQGAGFDAPLWSAACEAVGMHTPWQYFNVLDARTVYEICRFNQKSIPKVGTHHHALDDCRFQVIAVQSALRSIGVV